VITVVRVLVDEDVDVEHQLLALASCKTQTRKYTRLLRHQGIRLDTEGQPQRRGQAQVTHATDKSAGCQGDCCLGRFEMSVCI
jgi:hypothetical protein